MSFYEFLTYAGGPGVGVVVGFLLSFLIEYWPWFAGLADKPKRLVFFGFCFVLPVLCAILKGACGYEGWTFDPLFWQALVSGFAAAFGGTLAHARKLSAA